jgi:lipopolysaccharide transport system ATP-binding protein
LFGDNTLPYTNNSPITAVAGEKIQSIFSFKLPMLPNGEYSVMASLAEGTLEKHTQHHWLHNALNLHVVSSEVRWGLVGIEFDKIILSKY